MKFFINNSEYPTNLYTVMEWRTFARAIGRASWRAGARQYAASTGRAFVIRADGALVKYYKDFTGKVRQSTYRADGWKFTD